MFIAPMRLQSSCVLCLILRETMAYMELSERLVEHFCSADESDRKYFHRVFHDAPTMPAQQAELDTKTPPSWFNRKLYEAGQRCFRENSLSMVVLHLVGLLQILRVPSILAVLVGTGKSACPVKAFSRYLETIRMVWSWYCGDIFSQHTQAYSNIQLVIDKHQRAFSKHRRADDVCQLVTPSMLDMVLTQWAFCGLCVCGACFDTGLSATSPHHQPGLEHFWRCVGYRLGIPDNLNVCCGDIERTRLRCRVLHLLLSLRSHTLSHYWRMSCSMLTGVCLIVPLCNPLMIRHHSVHLSTRTLLSLNHTSSLTLPSPPPPPSLYSQLVHSLMIGYLRVTSRDDVISAVLRSLSDWLLRFAIFCCHRWPVIPLTNYRCQMLCGRLRRSVVEFWHRLLVVATSGGRFYKLSETHSKNTNSRESLQINWHKLSHRKFTELFMTEFPQLSNQVESLLQV